MPSHYFHSTNGEDVVFDERGRRNDRMQDVRAAAEAAALRIMRSVPGYRDWSGWIVCVYDDEGRCVDEIPFPPAPPAPRLQKRATAKRPALAAA